LELWLAVNKNIAKKLSKFTILFLKNNYFVIGSLLSFMGSVKRNYLSYGQACITILKTGTQCGFVMDLTRV